VQGVGEQWIFSSTSRSFGYGYKVVMIRVKQRNNEADLCPMLMTMESRFEFYYSIGLLQKVKYLFESNGSLSKKRS
jgi:hypothetical protein